MWETFLNASYVRGNWQRLSVLCTGLRAVTNSGLSAGLLFEQTKTRHKRTKSVTLHTPQQPQWPSSSSSTSSLSYFHPLWQQTSYFSCSGRLAVQGDGSVICMDSKVYLLSWRSLTTARLFIHCVKHLSQDINWIAASCCFESPFTRQQRLSNWIRNVLL